MQLFSSLHNLKNSLILVLLLLQFSAISQFERLRNFTVKDGLPGSETYGVTQDSKGYIWVVGDMGVNRFDGYEFHNYNSKDGLPDNTIFGVWEDAKERIWFRSFSGRLSYFKNDSIYSLQCNDTIQTLLSRGINISMYVDEKDTIWLGVNRNFLLKIGPGWKNKDVKKITLNHGKYVFCSGKNGLIYGGSNPEKMTITVYNTTTASGYILDPGLTNSAGLDLRFFVTRTKAGDFLAGIDNVVFRFNSNYITSVTRLPHMVIHLMEDEDDSIFASTYNGVYVLYGKQKKNIRTLPTLSGKVVTWAHLDKEGELWFTTEGNGLFCEEHRKFRYYTPENGLPVSKISCIGFAGNRVVTGHLDGSLCILKNDTLHTLTVNKIKNSSVLQTRINSIFSRSEDAIVTTVGQSYTLKGMRLSEIPIAGSTGIKKLMKTNDGNLWAMSYSRIIKLDTRNLSWIKDTTFSGRIDNVFEDSKGIIWIAQQNKIWLYDEKKMSSLSEFEKSFDFRIVEMGKTADKNSWIITRGGGVIIYNGKEFKQLTEKDGLAGNMCKCLMIDSNIVWVGTNKGLSRITRGDNNGLTIDNIYESHGLLTNEINSIIKHNSKLWIAHNTGISVFDPKNLKTNSYSMPVYILSATANDSIQLNGSRIKLTYAQNNITINYIGLSYKNAGNIEYKYKMGGLDSSWTYTKYTSIKFHTMPAGNYTFYVYAKNNDGYWSKSPATLSFTIKRAWWQTIKFRLALSLFWVLVILILFKLRLRMLQKRDKEKSELQNRIAQTELKALRSQMNPHFVYNAINSVQYFILNNDPESSQKYLAKFARLIRYVVDNSKPTSIPLQTEVDALILYLELEALRFETMFEYKVEVDPNIDTTYVQIPSMLVQPYVENAIWHGLMHKKEKGNIKIRFTMESDVLKCVIEDDGIGRKRSQEIKNNTSVISRKSLGMSITKERLEIIGQMNNTELSVTILDIEDERGIALGTRVELLIPFN